MTDKHSYYMQLAIDLAKKGMDANAGGPFGCVIVKDDEIIAQCHNRVTSTNDPTAHAEVVAIREACKTLSNFQLHGCTLYTSCEPCPMCLGAIYWARPDKVFFACSKEDAAVVDFDDHFIYDEIDTSFDKRKIPFQQMMQEEGQTVFTEWLNKEDKIEY